MSLNSAHEGYDYQDLLTSYFILKEVLEGRKKSVFSVDKKNTPSDIPDSFDDLVIVSDRGIQRKQIKYSNDNVSKKLEKGDLSNNSGYKLAVYELYRTWKELNTHNSEFRLCLAWDSPTEENIRKVLEPLNNHLSSFDNYQTKLYKINLDNLWEENPEKFNRWDSLKNYVKSNGVDRNDFKNFCDELLIELELPKASLQFNAPSDLENILFQQAEKLGIGKYPNDDVYIHDFLERLAKKVGEYRTRSAEKTGENILKDLRVKTDFGKIEQKFNIDQTKNIKFSNKYIGFENKVVENKKTLLIGEPGSGKSWFLTNFIEHLEENDKKVIRHYCFTDTEDEHIEKRVSSNVFFGNLIADIIKKFSKLQEIKDKLFVSNLDELNLLLSHIDENLIIIIDGLDHINRVMKNSSQLSLNKTKIIEYISQIVVPDNISIVLGSQPVDEVQTLIDSFDYIEYKLPKWDIDNTIELMSKYSLNDSLLESKQVSEYIFEKSEGNPLYLTYIIKTLTNQNITIEVINTLPQYDFNLKNYYKYLTTQISDNLTSEILSCLEFSVTKEELKEIIPRSSHLDNNLKVLSPIISENLSRGGIKLYHDSFRRFTIEKLEANVNLKEIYSDIAKWLKQQGFYKNSKSYRYLLNYYIKLEKYKKVKQYATNDFLTKSLYSGYSEAVIKKNYDNFLFVAKESQDWGLFAYISELNRTIFATISEEYRNEFIERFELYFEAVGLIYGFEKANSILFFDGKQNFSDEIIAKAFYVSQNNGYIPNWNLIEKYFQETIPLENYKYYISSLIALDIDLFEEFKELLDEEYKDFFIIFIEEVYKHIGFECILNFYERLEKSKTINIAKKINKVLNKTNCSQRILIKFIKKQIVLKELNLNFINDYIKEQELNNFHFLVSLYATYNSSVLRKFEQTIPSKNFFYNWLKFFIRNIIIEVDIDNNKFNTYEELENTFLENFKFLASDVAPFKGKPRAIDFANSNTELIKHTILKGLRYIQSQKAWSAVIVYLNKIEACTYYPLRPISLVEENYLNHKNIHKIINSYGKFDKKNHEYYVQHLEYKLKKSIYYSKVDKKTKAHKELKKAMRLVTSYTFRKDRTLSEIIEPLQNINRLDNEFSKKYAKKLKYLNDAMMKYTEDGKDMRWLTIEWFEEFLKVDYKLASMYLITQLLNDEYLWKLDYMFVNFIQSSHEVNPILLNFLYKLSPTNDKNDYINSFLDNTYQLIKIDKNLAKQSLISILERDLNNSRDELVETTIKKIQVLKNLLNVSIPITKTIKKETHSTFSEKRLDEKINEKFSINTSLGTKNINKLIEDFDINKISEEEAFFIIYSLQETNNEKQSRLLLHKLSSVSIPLDTTYFDKVYFIVQKVQLEDNLKIHLLVEIFVNSKDGWFSNFVNKEALKDAMEIDKQRALKYLAKSLQRKFNKIYYYSQSTANLIIAFEYVGLKKKDILSMYQKGFEFIEYRLPDKNDFKWKGVKDKDIDNMSNDEMAIVMILVKMKNLDVSVQKEIIMAVSYLVNYDCNLLIKPFKWLFAHIEYFPHISIAAILELFLLYVDSKEEFFQQIKDDLLKVESLDNLYIKHCLYQLLERLEYV